MNKTKISGKIKSLALLCLYTTIRIGGASIVSSCGREDAPAKGINDFAKIKANLEKEKTDAIKAKDEAINDKKAVETENTKLKKEKTILSKKATVQEVFDALLALNKKIFLKRSLSPDKWQKNHNEKILLTAHLAVFLLEKINNLVNNTEEKSLTDDMIYDIIYSQFEKYIKEEYLIQEDNPLFNYSKGFIYFIDAEKKNTKTNILQCKVKTSANQEIMAPVLICHDDMQEFIPAIEDPRLTVIPTNSPKEMLKGIYMGYLQTNKKNIDPK